MTSKSKYDYIALFITLMTIVLYVGGFIFAMSDTTHDDMMLVLLFVVISVWFVLDCSLLYWDTKRIVFNSDRAYITFKQLITNKETTYLLKDMDGVLESRQVWAGGRAGHKILYLVKDTKIIERISSVFIDNYNEIDFFLKNNNVPRLIKENNSIAFDIQELFGQPSIKKS
jgi:hypothetical protein